MAMKKLIMQVGIFDPKLSTPEFLAAEDAIRESTESVKDYAHRVGADYMFIDDTMGLELFPTVYKTLHIFQNKALDDYDLVWNLDIDTVAGFEAPNVFDYIDPSYELHTNWDATGTWMMKWYRRFWHQANQVDKIDWQARWPMLPSGGYFVCGGCGNMTTREFRLKHRERSLMFLNIFGIKQSINYDADWSDEVHLNFTSFKDGINYNPNVNWEYENPIYEIKVSKYNPKKIMTSDRRGKELLHQAMIDYRNHRG